MLRAVILLILTYSPCVVTAQGSNSVEWHAFSNCSSNLTMPVPHNGWVLANVGELRQLAHAQPHYVPSISCCRMLLLCMPGLIAGRYR
jgi:hypothetical protein